MSQPPPVPPTPLQYATPAGYAAPANGMWRRGMTLIVGRAARLPPLCIRCGEPEAKSYSKTTYWHPQWYFLLILFPGLLIYAIVALIVRKKSTYSCSLCVTHVKQKRNATLLVWLGIVLMFGAFALALAGGNDAFGRANGETAVLVGIVAGIVLLLTTLIYGMIRLPLLKPKFMDEHYAHYTGAGPNFLAPLGELT